MHWCSVLLANLQSGVGVFLTSIFNVLSQAGWKLSTSNGSGAGIEPKITFAELYVFSRQCNASSEVHTFSTLS